VLAGSFLLFFVQPMYGRLLLPRLGGAPAVWATSMVFFQVCLLAGYAYAHALGQWIPARLQPAVHALVLFSALFSLPLTPPHGSPPPGSAFPFGWLLGELSLRVALPFVAISATAPLVQRWYSKTRLPSASDPYFLYAASNVGSLTALIAYPVLVEPLFSLQAQARLWSYGYAALAALELACVVVLLVAPAERSLDAASAPHAAAEAPHPRDLVRWAAFAFVPSSAMLGVTSYATTDIAPVPLLWVIPLAIYLTTYAIAFMKRPIVRHDAMVRALPVAIVGIGFLFLLGLSRPIGLVLPLHFAALFVIAMACHGELARRRPAARHLTMFYLVTAAGGALGGLANGLVAPLVLSSVIEYPLVVAAAAVLRAATTARPQEEDDWRVIAGEAPVRRGLASSIVRRAGLPAGLWIAAATSLWATRKLDPSWSLLAMSQLATAISVVALSTRKRPARFAACASALLLAPWLAARGDHLLYAGRSFFGVHRVQHDAATARNVYIQGTTIHGLQSVVPERRRIAGAYFHESGPAGDVLAHTHPARVALVGLGIGSLAAYAERGQTFTFFEIDPLVARIAENTTYFTYLADARARGAAISVVLGDGRLLLERAPIGAYDMIVIDAYSSDVIPVHLLTREAFVLYESRLAPGGVILMNVSNRYLDVGLVVAAVAHDLKLAGRERLDPIDTDEGRAAERDDGKSVSRWIELARTAPDFRPTAHGWRPLPQSTLRTWTDDYVNVLGCLN
jgi:hypothetical protein